MKILVIPKELTDFEGKPRVFEKLIEHIVRFGANEFKTLYVRSVDGPYVKDDGSVMFQVFTSDSRTED